MHMAAILYINLKVKTDQEKKLQKHFGKTFSRCFNVNVNVTPKTFFFKIVKRHRAFRIWRSKNLYIKFYILYNFKFIKFIY